MTLEELGSALREEREKRNISIEEAAEELKINPRILKAIESGDSTNLPPAYIKGFIRTYRAYLGLDNEKLQTLSQGGANEPASVSKTAPIAKSAPADVPEPVKSGQGRESRESRVWGKLAWAACFAVVIAGGCYWAYSQGYMPFWAKEDSNRIDSIEQLPNANTWIPPTQAAAPEKPLEEAAASAEIKETASVPAPAAELKTEGLPPASVEEPAPGPGKAADESSAAPSLENPSHHKLIITATEECWVHSRSDKTDTRQFSLRKGDSFALTFDRELELKLGNAGGVALRYDGRELPPPGSSGQVRTITFPPKEN